MILRLNDDLDLISEIVVYFSFFLAEFGKEKADFGEQDVSTTVLRLWVF